MQGTESNAAVQLSWALQAALAAGTTAACTGVALTFRRPAMRTLAAAFLFITIAAGVIWWALAASSQGLTPAAATIRIALALPLTPVLTYFFFRQMIEILAGRATHWVPPLVPMAAVTAGTLLVSVAIALATGQIGPAPVGVLGTAATVLASGLLAWAAWRSGGPDGTPRTATLLLVGGFVALGLRSGVNVGVAAVAAATGQPPAFSLGVTVMQAFLLVAGAVLLLTAVLDQERTQGVLQAEQLRDAERAIAASRRMESLGRMAGAVAHDFNNLLTVIALAADSARAATAGAGGAGAAAGAAGAAGAELDEVTSAARRGRELTQQLLAFARQAPQQVTRFDASEHLAQMVGLLQRIAGKLVTLDVAHGGPAAHVEMDRTQFDQVVMNLVSNARDATPAGGRISVSLARDDGFVKLTVTDTGAGIPAAVLPHIFEPFYSTKGGEGSGLGLATCDGIVRRAGGRIEVSPGEPGGTTFTVMLPSAGDEEPAAS